MKTPKFLYHATPRVNLSNIMSDGIRTGKDGRVWFASDKNRAVTFSRLHHPDTVFSIIPVMCEEYRIFPDDKHNIDGNFYSLEHIRPDCINSDGVTHKRIYTYPGENKHLSNDYSSIFKRAFKKGYEEKLKSIQEGKK